MFNCVNSSSYSESACRLKNQSLGFFHAILSPVIFSLNLLLIVAFFKTKQAMSNSSNFLIMCILASDLLNGAIAVPLVSYFNFTSEPPGCNMPPEYEAMLSFFGSTTFLLTIVLAADRYIHMNPSIERPTKCARIFKRPYLYVIVTLVVVSSLTYQFICVIVAGRFCLAAIKKFVDTVMLMICLLYFIFSYIHGYLRIRKFVDNSPVYQNETNRANRPQYVLRLHRHIMVLIISLIVGYVPLLVHKFVVGVYTFSKTECGSSLVCIFNDVIIPVLFVSRLASPFIVLCYNKDMRTWVRMCVRMYFCSHSRTKDNNVATVPDIGTENPGSAVV